MEHWSVGVLGQVRIAPRDRGVGDAVGAADCPFQSSFDTWCATTHPVAPLGRTFFKPITPGLKPRAESLSPFGTKTRTSLRGQRWAATIRGATLRLIRALCSMHYRQKIWQPGPASRITDPSAPLTSHESLLTRSMRSTLARGRPLTRIR